MSQPTYDEENCFGIFGYSTTGRKLATTSILEDLNQIFPGMVFGGLPKFCVIDAGRERAIKRDPCSGKRHNAIP